MAVQLARRLFTVTEYEQMITTGVLGEDDRVELLEGELVQMSPIGSRHAACVKRINRLLIQQLASRAIVGVQDPVRLDEYSEPEPDLAVLAFRADYYAEAHPGPGDVLLLIEVADTSDDRLCWRLVGDHGVLVTYRHPFGAHMTQEPQTGTTDCTD